MPPDPVTVERIYAAIKSDLKDCSIRPGVRLDIGRLADDHRASATPVREALNRLLAERMLGFRRGEGFHALRLEADEIRQLYAWNAIALQGVVAFAAASAGDTACSSGAPALDGVDYPQAVATMFARIAGLSGLNEVCLAVEALNDRLHVVRRAEVRALGSPWEDLDGLSQAIRDQKGECLRKAIAEFHDRRLGQVSIISDCLGYISRFSDV